MPKFAASRSRHTSSNAHEINGETYAICKADLLLKGDGEAVDNIGGGPEHSTLSSDAFRAREFDFMLANPPYGKCWRSDLERMGGKKDLKNPRFVIAHDGDSEYSLVTQSFDGAAVRRTAGDLDSDALVGGTVEFVGQRSGGGFAFGGAGVLQHAGRVRGAVPELVGGLLVKVGRVPWLPMANAHKDSTNSTRSWIACSLNASKRPPLRPWRPSTSSSRIVV